MSVDYDRLVWGGDLPCAACNQTVELWVDPDTRQVVVEVCPDCGELEY